MVYHGGTDANQNSGVGENDHIDKLNSICVRNRVNILPKCGFLNYFSYLCGVRAAKRQTDNNREFKEII